MPLFVDGILLQEDNLHIITTKKIKTVDYKKKIAGAFDYHFTISKVNDGYNVRRTVKIENNVYSPSQLTKILIQSTMVDKKEAALLKIGVK
jgi:hypothetical protein